MPGDVVLVLRLLRDAPPDPVCRPVFEKRVAAVLS
jgi:hypothetical protein